MRVDGVITHEWIPFLKSYGPLGVCTLKVKDILNLLNNDVNVILSEEKNKDLYVFVKEYNTYADVANKPKVLRAEEVLYERVYKTAIRLQEEDDKDNPFVEDPEEEAALASAVTAMDNKTTAKKLVSPIQNNLQVPKKPKIYDMIAAKRERTPTQNSEETIDMIEYGDIEFE